MKKKVRVRQRVSKVRVLRNEKTLPQRKMYTPRVKLCGCTWVFTIGDAMFIGDVMPAKAENGEKPEK